MSSKGLERKFFKLELINLVMAKLEDPQDPAFKATKQTFIAILNKKNDLLPVFLE